LTGWSARERWALCGLATASVVVQIPFLQRGISLLDEGSILALADAIARGSRLYADHRTPLAPLTYELLAQGFKLFGAALWVPRVLQAAIFSGSILLTVAILARIVPARAALLGGLALLAIKPLGYMAWTVISYSPLSLLFALGALWALLMALPGHQARRLFAAGLAVGLAAIAKQNLGLLTCTTAGVVITIDWLLERPRRGRDLLQRTLALAGGAAIPVAAIAARYAYVGAARDLFEQAVVAVLGLSEGYWIPLPPIAPWSPRAGDLVMLVFAYFPAGIVQLVLEGRLSLESGWMVPGLEFWMKIMYLAPPLACASLIFLLLLRWRDSTLDRVGFSQRFALLLFSAFAYASMLYRADWAHLMNVAPPLVAVVTLAIVEFSARVAWLGRAFGAGLLALWLVGAGAAAWAVLTVNSVPVETARGRLLGPAHEAREVQRVLDWISERSEAETIAFLPSQPLYYFLSGRPLQVSQDLLGPSMLVGRGDKGLAQDLRSIDWVVYNPTRVPFIAGDVTDYAPHTARMLARAFEVDQSLSPAAVVLRRRDRAFVPEVTIADFWEQLRERAESVLETKGSRAGSRASTEVWMLYHVVSAPAGPTDAPTCFEVEHSVEAGDTLIVSPLFPPALWARDEATEHPPSAPVRFAVSLSVGGQPETSLDLRVLGAGIPGGSIRRQLDPWSGQRVRLHFCASSEFPADVGDRPLVGWAEPRIVRRRSDGSVLNPGAGSHTP
jgi:hypothetical protein